MNVTVECIARRDGGEHIFLVHVSRVPVVEELVLRKVGSGWEIYRVDAVHHYGWLDTPPPDAVAAVLYVAFIGCKP